MIEKKPFEIARETLKRLTERKLAPTPVHYKALYNEIAGIPTVEHFPLNELRAIAAALQPKTPGQVRQKGLLESAIDRMHWDGVQTALIAYAGYVPATATDATVAAPLAPRAIEPPAAPEITADFLAQIGRMLAFMQPALGQADTRFTEQTEQLIQALKDPGSPVTQVKQLLAQYSHRLSFAAEDQVEIKASLLKLLNLMFENIADLGVDDHWLQGQMQALRDASVPPLTLRRLDEVEQLLKDVIAKQKEAKQKTLDAQEEMRTMLAAFVERLSLMSQTTGHFQQKLEESARQIETAKSLADIAPVLKDVVLTTRSIAKDTQSTYEELHSMREQASRTQDEIAKLHRELDRVSLQARHDPLTGALNRRGLEEALEKEISTVRRKETPLSVALLDIDDFKALNDSLGHESGDGALAHLAQVARECMRPQDSLARFGGEEFVVLLPDTSLDNAVEAMRRLQRELTKRFFLAGTEKVLITFSAGVAQLSTEEPAMEAIRRADQAMYLAKRAGKNRVIAT